MSLIAGSPTAGREGARAGLVRLARSLGEYFARQRAVWVLFVCIWGLFVLLPDLLVRRVLLTARYPVALLGSLVLWASVLLVVAHLRRVSRPIAVGVAALFAAAVTLTVVCAQGYFQFFKADVKSLEWEFFLENPHWAFVLARDAITPGQLVVMLLAPIALTLALLRVSRAVPAGRRSLRSFGGIALAFMASGAIMLFARPLSADLVGLRAVIMGSRQYFFRGADPRSLPLPHRVALPARTPANRPDVVLIIHESLGRREAVGPGTEGRPTAAFLARHPDRVVQFPRATSLATATTVSIPIILSGLEAGAPREDFARAPLVWHSARANGYRTALFSAQEFAIDLFATFFLGQDAPDVARTAPDYRHPIERVNELGVDDRLAVDEALAFLGQEAKKTDDRPYLMVVQLNATHWPCWTPTLGAGKWRGEGVNPTHPDPVRCAQADRFVDEQVARILTELETLGRIDRTLVISTSDHGEVFRPERPQRRLSFYDDVLGIPFYVHLPAALIDRMPVLRQNAAQRVSNLDIVPTLLDVWDEWPPPPGRPALVGQSLLKPLPARVVVSTTDSTISKETPGFALFFDHYKWIFCEVNGANLFDLEADPGELHDLGPQAPASALAALKEELARRPGLQRYAHEVAPALVSLATN